TYELIRRLKQNGYRLGLLTNTSATYFEGRTSQLGIFPLFDAVTTSFQTGLMKPDRRMYEDIARKLGASPEQCLLIDDIAEYAEEARQIRMKAIHYQSPEQLVDELKREGIRI
ncbi:HAD-IA family hydrolase, partial [Candidatus Woesearchaeota archaeon]|nr:HAD-IA family hydrolase [Candidatus Woesearchaeota archaeon]